MTEDRSYWKIKMTTLHHELKCDIYGFSVQFPKEFLNEKTLEEHAWRLPKFRAEEFEFVKNFVDGKEVKFRLRLDISMLSKGNLFLTSLLDCGRHLSEPATVNVNLEFLSAEGTSCWDPLYLGLQKTDLDGCVYFTRELKFKVIWANQALCFSDDVLRIRLKLTIGGIKHVNSSGEAFDAEALKAQAVGSLMHGLSDMRKSDGQETSDFNIICSSEKFPVHKAILSARSPVFARMLATEMKETKSGFCEINDIEPSVLSALLDFIYTAKMPCNDSDVELLCGVALAADKYELLELQKYSLNLLKKNVNCETFALVAKTFYLCTHGKGGQDPIWEFC